MKFIRRASTQRLRRDARIAEGINPDLSDNSWSSADENELDDDDDDDDEKNNDDDGKEEDDDGNDANPNSFALNFYEHAPNEASKVVDEYLAKFRRERRTPFAAFDKFPLSFLQELFLLPQTREQTKKIIHVTELLFILYFSHSHEEARSRNLPRRLVDEKRSVFLRRSFDILHGFSRQIINVEITRSPVEHVLRDAPVKWVAIVIGRFEQFFYVSHQNSEPVRLFLLSHPYEREVREHLQGGDFDRRIPGGRR